MEKQRLGGGLLLASSVLAPWIGDMLGLRLPPLIGYPLLAVCGLLVLVGVWLLFRQNGRDQLVPEDEEEGKEKKPYTGPTTGLRIDNCSDNTFVGTPRIYGFDTAVELRNSDRNKFHGGIHATAPRARA